MTLKLMKDEMALRWLWTLLSMAIERRTRVVI
jgi:hypothetical protein